jgi:tetratricopeptide (TPR) repeat protein
LNEALAEITSAYVGHSGFRTPSKFNKFGRRVLLPDDCAARNDMQFKKGVIQFSNGDASAAIHTLLPVIESEPNLATPHAVLAASYAKTSDLSHALQQLEGAMKCFSAAGVPWTEPSVDFARRWLPFCDGPSAYFYQDVGPSNETLLNIPFEFSALFHRFQIEEHQKKYAAAACDLYWYRFGSGLAWLLRDGGTEPYIVGQELNRKVENSHGISTRVPLMCRAHFFEWLGDKKKNVREGRDLYRRALADYRNAFELDRSRKEVLLDCCTVSLKLNDKVAAERYESQGLTEHPDAIETQIMHIQILNAQGKQTNTEEAYKQFIRENLGKILRPE